ncbi:hypothetical protein N7499_002526 [Penicillium canescens]|uniref:CRAL-TRIO domain-containing protein n=1 Tax=Penicillium canescens TaxID=5083 RepID=A0AAD6I8K7_PENCN|nr:uncharacterized protein N7446_010128 [Penicillium canescens]KAJ6001571.1 hypothetical protein N7522_006798 [Penicillium canescens]KAJ6035369.1 hypothetical protein N7460_009544 [Penicillium canescens]KAJ6054116.1 hypothetical protein N7446_010128 [Penicillium canescens]KAJ6098152.1 hypothetical protein N7499_002526 [Penicillium canescens]
MSIHQILGLKIPPEHEDSFASLTRLCDDHNLLNQKDGHETRDLRDGLSDPSTLLRFLTARRFDPDAALEQYKEACQFRQEKAVLKLYDIIPITDFEQARQFYPHWTGRRCKNGVPICMFDLAYLDKDGLASWEKSRQSPGWKYSPSEEHQPPTPDMIQSASIFHDSLTRFVLPLCSMMKDRPNSSVPITNFVYLVDASNLGLKQGWSVRFFAQEISWLLSTCYPETIQRIFVCNAPSYFATIWKYLKGWVDPYTAEKIVILSDAEVLPTLREHIDDANIPSIFGGGFPFKHGMLPDLDNNIRQRLNWDSPEKSVPPGPIKWAQESDGKIVASAVGSQVGSARNDKIAEVDCMK